ncbi:UDP-2,4-diacetamido-2,4,6-trideoxy-beta-L-altropyranose hydrolase [Solitalea sp. MAHUQ-68]|uniref:UDP-2,4-diacetamido-2,4, 6-trideoxy-beta-L-altropyranose hydrolase n=1 Tax=Solitalea agri TaxID=2953739 RepID=A0A9X2F2C7_9SPHI|nr:UDP-2,4-diacetamido-2,4,6-trideoxy-beta-L-altropyranose hydrolase [Solitalea agri]MCO4292941.1 UDP-2,4-diacetamido-2,4,6-trideoxy-beta-L-altropyranose hydrolase [Solitalea agri]
MDQGRRTVYLRADGNSQIGLGHVVRTLALAEMLKAHFNCIFLIREPKQHLIEQLLMTCSEVIKLSSDGSFVDEAAEIASRCLSPEDIIVIDGYSFETEYQRLLKKSGCKLVAIDDLHKWHMVADVIINQAGNIESNLYSCEPYTRFYLGPHYALLRPAFLQKKPYQFNDQLMINLGGADPENISLKVLSCLHLVGTQFKVKLVVGAANKHLESIENFIKINNDLKVEIRLNLSADQMAEAIAESGLVICSCSSISYEAAAIGRPIIGIQTADNQKDFRSFLEDETLALLTIDKDFKSSELISGIYNYLRDKSQREEVIKAQEQYFDGQSGSRLLNVFLAL